MCSQHEKLPKTQGTYLESLIKTISYTTLLVEQSKFLRILFKKLYNLAPRHWCSFNLHYSDQEPSEIPPDFSQVPGGALSRFHLDIFLFLWKAFYAAAPSHLGSLFQDSAQTPDSSLIFTSLFQLEVLLCLFVFPNYFIILILPSNFQSSRLVINLLFPPHFLMSNFFEDRNLC